MNQYLPSAMDIVLIVGLTCASVGISYHWSWPVALITLGATLQLYGILAKLRGNN